MKRNVSMFLIILYIKTASCDINTDKYATALFPQIYAMDDYSKCMANEDLYCKVNVRLEPQDKTDVLWKQIENTKNSKTSFDRSKIYRSICIPREVSGNNHSIKTYSEKMINNELRGLNLTARIYKTKCKNEQVAIPYENLMLLAMIFYGLLVGYATIYDRKKRKIQEKTKSKLDDYLIAFSLITNWKKVTSPKSNDDSERLKSIQGIRLFNTILVIGCHAKLCFCFVYVKNPELLEYYSQHPMIKILHVLDLYLVQTFFLISSWLLTNQIYEHFRKNGKFSLNDCFILLLNRLFRLWPAIVVMIFYFRVLFVKYAISPITFETINMFTTACDTNWVATVLYLNSFLPFADMCNPVTWYLAVDTQYYIFTIIVLYVTIKYKLDSRKVLGVLIVVTIIIYSIIIYVNGFNAMFMVTPEEGKLENFFYSHQLQTMYLSPFSSWTTNVVGICLGTYYFKNKNNNGQSKDNWFIWLAIFAGVPLLVIIISHQDIQGIQAAIVGPFLKPLFSLGIGIGILAMSKNIITGSAKKICEWKYAVILSNFTFSTYVFHASVVFAKGAFDSAPIDVDIRGAIMLFFVYVVLSFGIGIFFTLFVEQPGTNLQKMLLPQIKNKKVNVKTQ